MRVASLILVALLAPQFIIRIPPVVGTNPIAASRQPGGDTSSPNLWWAAAGYSGGIPTRSTVCSALSSGATAAQIETAVSSCTAGQVITLPAGTWTLGAFRINKGITLRGAGADQTKLSINSAVSIVGTTLETAVRIGTTTGSYGCSTDCSGAGPNNSTTWTAGYAQGTTAITLGGHTNLTVNSMIFLDQLEDSSDGYPAAGDLYECSTGPPCSWEGGNAWARDGRSHTEVHEVTACGTSVAGAACTSNSITITPPILSPDYRSGQTPGAWWGGAGAEVHGAGIEELSIDFTASESAPFGAAGIGFQSCMDCYVRGVRLIHTSTGSNIFHVLCFNCLRVTTRDNYIYGPTTAGNQQYSYSPNVATSLKAENNILHHNVTPMAANDPEVGSVYAYNYVDDSYYSPGPQAHNSGDLLNLAEGNDIGSWFNDSIHGTHYFWTFLRNFFSGTTHNTTGVSSYGGLVVWSHNRFHNVLGNVFGSSAYTTYQASETADCFNCVYALGFAGTHGCPTGCLGNDASTRTSMFRWGNYDNVTGTIRWNTGEVPSGITNYLNPVPATQTVPSSLYLSAKPTWFGSIPWPPTGPDVTGGNLSTNTGSHTNKIPARVCFEAAVNDPAYPSSSPRIKTFNATTCYGSTGRP